ncbi:hypothetical protein THAOC_11195 [Thalassiosira oceanica]|uniref:Uncharacterized protein n=1 Tax=Thalassiosira oceanica TaxID=159749 RepID=K0T352_THAOC|nr:hypothetical protein THAOC_11195 [Thalassiosira oceanica]|eukprot:EJK67736.1 hypothetical protein THAOC_11195 [Thalassiosira oceanica]
MYLADSPEPNSTYASLPEEWDRVDYTVVDRLIIGPLGIQSDGHFGLVGDEGKFGSLDDRFDRVLSDARRSNPSIEIECPQTEWGRSLCALQAGEEERFASEVIGFLEQHDLFGFNIDYEASNVQPTFAELGRAIRAAFGDDYNFSDLTRLHSLPGFGIPRSCRCDIHAELCWRFSHPFKELHLAHFAGSGVYWIVPRDKLRKHAHAAACSGNGERPRAWRSSPLEA